MSGFKYTGIPADGLCRGIPGYMGKGGIDHLHNPPDIGNRYAFDGIVEYLCRQHQVLLHFFPAGDVADIGDNGILAREHYLAQEYLDLELRTVMGTACLPFEQHGFAFEHLVPCHGKKGHVVISTREMPFDGHGECFFFCYPVEIEHPVVDIDDPSIHIMEEYGVVDTVENGFEGRFRLPEPELHLLAFRYIQAGTDKTAKQAGGGKVGGTAVQDPAVGSIGRAQAVFRPAVPSGIRIFQTQLPQPRTVGRVNPLQPAVPQFLPKLPAGEEQP